MTLDEHNSLVRAVFQELRQIADTMANPALDADARTAAANRHAELVRTARDLNDQMLVQLGIKPA